MKTIEYAKWSATYILIIGTGVNSLGIYPLGPIILAVGGFVWMICAIIMKEMPLIVTNFVMTLVGIIGIFLNYFDIFA